MLGALSFAIQYTVHSTVYITTIRGGMRPTQWRSSYNVIQYSTSNTFHCNHSTNAGYETHLAHGVSCSERQSM